MSRLVRAAWLVALVGSGCEELPPGGDVRGTPEPDAIWVTTYNVNFERPSEETVRAIVEADADVVFLQETNEAWDALFQPELGDRYPHVSALEAQREGGMTLLSRYPIAHQEERTPTRASGFPASCVTVSSPIGELDVVHVHLHPPLDGDGRLLLGYFTTGPIRRDELESHLECFDGDPDLVLGDFNEETGAAVRYLHARGMRQAQLAHPPVERTWSWQTSTVELQGRPDHVFFGPALEASAVQVVQAGASDHSPLRVALSEEEP